MTQQLNAKAYYLTMGAADAVIAALIKDDSAQGRLLDKFIAMSDKEREEFGDDKSDPDYAELDYGLTSENAGLNLTCGRRRRSLVDKCIYNNRDPRLSTEHWIQ